MLIFGIFCQENVGHIFLEEGLFLEGLSSEICGISNSYTSDYKNGSTNIQKDKTSFEREWI